jgi:hypothetical protein
MDHLCSVAELIDRFGTGSEEREAEINEPVQFIEAARNAGVRRPLVNGSFVTGKLAPNDVDVVFLPGPDYPRAGPGLDDEENRCSRSFAWVSSVAGGAAEARGAFIWERSARSRRATRARRVGLDRALSGATMRRDSLDDSADSTVASGFQREQQGISCETACRDDSE